MEKYKDIRKWLDQIGKGKEINPYLAAEYVKYLFDLIEEVADDHDIDREEYGMDDEEYDGDYDDCDCDCGDCDNNWSGPYDGDLWTEEECEEHM